MSDFGQPPPAPPYDPIMAYAQPLPPRPTSVTVLGIIGIIAAILWLLCGGFSLVMMIGSLSAGKNLMNFGNAQMPYSKVQTEFGAVSSALSVVLAATLLIGCIGALYQRPWSRSLIMGWSAVMLLFATAMLVVQLVWTGPEAERVMLQNNDPNIAKMRGFLHGYMIGAGCCTWLIYAALPICFLFFWRGEAVKAAFTEPPPGTLPPIQ